MKHSFGSNEKLVKAYVEQTSTCGRSGSLSFDDGILFSYAMPIARRLRDGSYLVRDAEWSPSQTTLQHIGMVKSRLDDWINVSTIPEIRDFETTYPFWFKQETENQTARACGWLERARTARTRRKEYITEAELLINNLEALLRKFDRLDIGERIIREFRADIERMS